MGNSLPLPPLEQRTIPDLLDRSAAYGLKRPWVVEAQSGKTLAYGDFLEHTAGAARVLAERFPGGSHIAVMLTNTVEFFIVRFALSCAGLVEVSMDGEQKGPILKGMLETAKPVGLIVETGYKKNVTDCGFDLTDTQLIEGAAIAELCTLRAPWSNRPAVEIAPGDPCRIIFTSGTTGASKGAVLSHAYEVFVGSQYADNVDLTTQDRFLYTTRLFHADAQFLIATMLHSGSSFILMRRFSASQFWPLAVKYGATSFLFVGTILAILCRTERPPVGHKMRFAFGGGCPGPVWERWLEHTGVPVVECFAMTECIACTLNHLDNPKIGTQGQAMSGYEVAVVDTLDQQCAAGERGEIVIRSNEPFAIMSGYLNNPVATLNSFRNLWFHTGDLGSMDDDGYLTFHGRAKDALRVKGENVSAEELQNLVDTHPDVIISGAVGVPSELGDEEILLYVQPKPDRSIDPQNLCDFIAQRAAAFMVPRYVRIIDTLPRSVSEKISKTTLARHPDQETWERPSARR